MGLQLPMTGIERFMTDEEDYQSGETVEERVRAEGRDLLDTNKEGKVYDDFREKGSKHPGPGSGYKGFVITSQAIKDIRQGRYRSGVVDPNKAVSNEDATQAY